MSDPGTSGEMLIGELAEATGVGVETLRFYEREEHLPEPPRTAAGYRQYSGDAVRSADTPDRFRRHGSPTVLVEGRDVTGADGANVAMACRADGAPSAEVIRRALAGHE